MKIVFLCGSLEPGRDGVGDYTRRLAGELVRKGHQAAIIAINDNHITEELSVQETEGITLPVLRLPSGWPVSQRFQRAGVWIHHFEPDWLSLQFVPFAFHPKGLAFGMGKLLNKLGKGKRWHVMMHELWVGMDKESPLKFVYWGRLQRELIKSLLTKIAPTVIHTQSNLYMQKLNNIGFSPLHLPLFGNISVSTKAIKTADEIEYANDISQTISFVMFGGIHPGAPINRLAEELTLYGKKNGVKILLRMVGRCGSEQQHWEKEWKAAGLSIELLGEQSPERISDVLGKSSFGISTTPVSLIEKSGSVAAMREHGLPVLCISRSWNPRGSVTVKVPAGVVVYEEGKIHDFITGHSKTYPENTISDIAFQFVNNLLKS